MSDWEKLLLWFCKSYKMTNSAFLTQKDANYIIKIG